MASTGLFSFTNLLINIFSDDEIKTNSYDKEKSFGMALAISLSLCKNIHNLPLRVEVLSENQLNPGEQAVLFHERNHYWQLLATPIHQAHFLCHLDDLGNNVEAQGLASKEIAACNSLFRKLEASEIEHYLQCIRAELMDHQVTDDNVVDINFSPIRVDSSEEEFYKELFSDVPTVVRTTASDRSAKHSELTGIEKIRSILDGYESRLIIMAYLHLDHPSPQYSIFPAYGALFRINNKNIIVPFTLRNLRESSCHLLECLSNGVDIPKTFEFEDDDTKQYLGTWEFFRRLHYDDYDNDRDLAFAFICVADLCMLTDTVRTNVSWSSDSDRLEATNIPYRFGKIAYRMLGMEPVVFSDTNITQSVKDFQERFCSKVGWELPNKILFQNALFLTRNLIENLCRVCTKAEDFRTLNFCREYLFEVQQSKIQEYDEGFDCILNLIARVRISNRVPFGLNVIGQMLNATIFRMKNPAHFAMPHIFKDELVELFPAPWINYQEFTYIEDEAYSKHDRHPLPLNSLELLQDVIHLSALEGLYKQTHEKKEKCGYRKSHKSCWYTEVGLGCPEMNLSGSEASMRELSGLGDWCYWKYVKLRLMNHEE